MAVWSFSTTVDERGEAGRKPGRRGVCDRSDKDAKTRREDSDRGTDADEDTTWESNPLPLMAKHPPRVTASNTKMSQDREGFLSQTCPKGENDLGWVQLQQKSFLWQEKIEGSLVLTYEGLTTMVQSSRTGWTIMRGTWNHLRKVWGPTPDTLAKIQDSCKTQKNLEEANVCSPTRHLLVIKRL